MAAFIFIVLSILYFLFGLHPLWNAEAMYAEVPREMLESKDFLYPTLNYAPFIFKPPLFFWANTLSIWLFGQNLGPRVPEAVFAAGTVVFTYKIAARSSKTSGLMAAGVLATSYGFVFHTAELLPDVPLGFFTACAVYYFLKISDGKNRTFGLWASLALAVMTKGFLGLIFPGIAFVIFIAAEGRRGMAKKLISLPAIAVFAAITVPWHILMELRNPGFLYDFIINEQVLRFFNERVPPDWDSIGSPLFFLITLAWMMPWAVFLFQGARMAVRKRDANLRMALYWGVGGMVFLLLSSQKMEYYQIPLLPPLAILAGGYFAALAEGRADRPTSNGRPAAAGSLALFLLGVAGAAAAPFILSKFSAELPAHKGGMLLSTAEVCLISLAAGGLAAFIFIRKKQFRKAFVAVLLTGIVLGAGSRPALDALLPELSDAESAKAAARFLRPGDLLVVQAREEYEYSAVYCYYTARRVLILRDGKNPMVPAVFNGRANFIITNDEFHHIWNSSSRVFLACRNHSSSLISLISKPSDVIYYCSGIFVCNSSENLNRD
ncbi:MAG: ArnT family glycosyltransferase [Nitrospirota bacterium]